MTNSVDIIPSRVLNTMVAGMVASSVRDTAEELAAKATAQLAAHSKTGSAKISVTHGRVDSYVNLDDPNAMAIEYGHGAYDQHRLSSTGKSYTQHVGASEGLHILTGLIP